LAALSGRPLLVLGMHRSGTSSFAGVAARLGAALGNDLLDANEFNPRGYGEHRGVVAVHDRFLASEGLRWDSARRPADFEGAAAREARDALRELLLREFAHEPLFAVKDPRLCRLLPLWRPLLQELGLTPAYAIVLRHPLEIAASLARRDGLEPARSHLLWLEHALPAERETRGAARSFVRYDELFGDWRAVAKRVAAECALRWPRDPEAAAGDVEAFLSGDLRHHRAAPESPAGDTARYPWVASLHAGLLALAERGTSPETCAALDRIGEEAAAAQALYAPELGALESRAASLEGELREAVKRARRAERKRDELAASPALWLRSFLRRRRGGAGGGGAEGA
jgi:hypothetical protein